MFATLTDKTGNRVEIEVLGLAELPLDRAGATLVLKRYTLESPLPVQTPGVYQLELADGSLIETEVGSCRIQPNASYRLDATTVVAAPALVSQ